MVEMISVASNGPLVIKVISEISALSVSLV